MTVPQFKRKPNIQPGINVISKRDVLRMARQIEKVWHDLGHKKVRCEVVRVGSHNDKTENYIIKSNLKNGLPVHG